MARFALLLTTIAVLSLGSRRADAQERYTFVSWSAEIPITHGLSGGRAVEAADSVRQKVGYNHWKGAGSASPKYRWVPDTAAHTP